MEAAKMTEYNKDKPVLKMILLLFVLCLSANYYLDAQGLLSDPVAEGREFVSRDEERSELPFLSKFSQ